MGWVDLSTLYVKKSGDTMTGSLTVPASSSLVCYNGTTEYNVGATLQSLQDSVSSLGTSVSSISTVTSGNATLDTSQIQSGGWVTWTKVGKVVWFYLYFIPIYYQSSYNTSPKWASGLPKNYKSGDQTCGVGAIDGKDGICLFSVNSTGELKCIRRNATINANTPIQGWGCYIAAS